MHFQNILITTLINTLITTLTNTETVECAYRFNAHNVLKSPSNKLKTTHLLNKRKMSPSMSDRLRSSVSDFLPDHASLFKSKLFESSNTSNLFDSKSDINKVNKSAFTDEYTGERRSSHNVHTRFGTADSSRYKHEPGRDAMYEDNVTGRYVPITPNYNLFDEGGRYARHRAYLR